MTAVRATLFVWALWAISWGLAAIWSRQTVSRPAGIRGSAHYIPTMLGTALLFAPAISGHPRLAGAFLAQQVWRLAPAATWVLCAGTIGSFAFAWWARLYLGSLWSGSITRKAEHRVVETGPYRLVRHPIYTGIIAASAFLALELGTAAGLAGAVVMTLGWWLKAREEERFLGEELGAAYGDYRRRTPMLLPFLGAPRRL